MSSTQLKNDVTVYLKQVAAMLRWRDDMYKCDVIFDWMNEKKSDVYSSFWSVFLYKIYELWWDMRILMYEHFIKLFV